MKPPVAAPTIVLAILAGAPPVMAAVPARLHDIRGPLSPPASFPFLLTTLLLAAALLLVIYRLRVRHRTAPAPPLLPGPAATDDLALLAGAWQRGEITAEALFERLTPLVRQHIASTGGIEPGPLTSQEIVRLAGLTPSAADLAAQILLTCDEVRFGNRPADVAAATAQAAARRLMNTIGTGRP